MTDKLNPSPDFPWLSDASRVVDWSVMLINRLKQELGINALRSNTLLPGDNPVRITLTAATTFFVSNAGSDTNNGLTAATPWLTIQHAINVLSFLYDHGGQTVTISVSNGTYPEAIVVPFPWVGGNMVFLVGNPGSPASVVINPTSGNAITLGTVAGGFASAYLSISGITLNATGGSNIFIADRCSMLIQGNVTFATCGASHMVINRGGSLLIQTTAITISGNAPTACIQAGANAIFAASGVYTMTGAPSFGVALFYIVRNATIVAGGMVFNGAATGKQYLIQSGAILDGGSRGTSWLPTGMTAGSTDGTGFFI